MGLSEVIKSVKLPAPNGHWEFIPDCGSPMFRRDELTFPQIRSTEDDLVSAILNSFEVYSTNDIKKATEICRELTQLSKLLLHLRRLKVYGGFHPSLSQLSTKRVNVLSELIGVASCNSLPEFVTFPTKVISVISADSPYMGSYLERSSNDLLVLRHRHNHGKVLPIPVFLARDVVTLPAFNDYEVRSIVHTESSVQFRFSTELKSTFVDDGPQRRKVIIKSIKNYLSNPVSYWLEYRIMQSNIEERRSIQ